MFKNIKKYVINLKKRPDRLNEVLKEFNYIGWDVDVFEGIDLGNHIGCAESHLTLIKKAKELNLDKIMVLEDDIFFMPYAKTLINDLEIELERIDYDVLNFNLSIHRKLVVSSVSNLLIDLTNLPDKKINERGVFGTGCMVYTKKMYDTIIDNYDSIRAIDEELDRLIYPNFKSYTSILPLTIQKGNMSDVSNDFYDNFYLQTYNWNQYCPTKIPNEYYDYNQTLTIRNNNEINYKDLLNK